MCGSAAGEELCRRRVTTDVLKLVGVILSAVKQRAFRLGLLLCHNERCERAAVCQQMYDTGRAEARAGSRQKKSDFALSLRHYAACAVF